ncbi:MAG: cell division protein ZapE [Alphaproteobacteria bacterium]|nr:cell division protein ZapE [Alphaproteobacteria bacterium]
MKQAILTDYERRIAAGELRPDPEHDGVLRALQNLSAALAGYAPPRGGFFARLIGKAAVPPRGLYIHGGVGRGKSMLMDMFFEHAPVARKRRVHFHQFMLEVHDWLHRQRQGGAIMADPLPRLAQETAHDAALLCFDEFHVGDIADAMILSRLFGALYDAGIVVVATSNWAPQDLYKDGLQRQRFLPFIDVLRAHMDIIHVTGTIDHRMARILGQQVYFTPLGPAATEKLAEAFTALASGAAPAEDELWVQQRRVHVPRAARGVAWFDFSELCGQPLGAADYLAIAQCYHTAILDGVPQLGPEQRNETVRFTTFIDALYENRAKLVMAAATAPENLCTDGPHAFAFQRTASRLMEMQAEDYIRSGHLSR